MSTSGLGGLPAFSPLAVAPGGGPVAAAARPARPAPRPAARRAASAPRKTCSGHRQCGKGRVCVENQCKVMRCASDLACPAESICHQKAKVCVVVKRPPINIMYLYYRSGDRRQTSVLGLYHHRAGHRGYRVMAPFYWHFWSRKRSTRVVFPFWVGIKNYKPGSRRPSSQHAAFLNFHYFRQENPRQVEFNIWPILFATSYGKRGGAFTLIPLFHYGRKGKRVSVASIVPPFFYYKRPGKVAWTFLPFTGGVLTPDKSFVWTLPLNFYWRKGTTKSWLFLPLYYGQTDRQAQRHRSVLFPLFYYERLGQQRHRFYSLLASYARDRREAWSWFFWTAPPMFFSRDRSRAIDLVFPLYFGYRDRLRRTSLHVVPPVVYYKDNRQRNFALLPLFYYFGDARTKSYATLLFPLFYRHRTQEGERLTVLGPWYLRRRPGGWASGLFPVAFFGSNKRSAHGVVFPLFWHFQNRVKKSTFTMLGNVFVTTGPKSWSFGVAPLIFAGSSPRSSHQVVFPVFWWFKDHVHKREWSVVGPAFWWRHGDAHGHGVFPFYWFQRRYLPSGHVISSTLIFPLMYHLNTPRKRVMITPIGGFSVDRVKRSETAVWGNIFWHRSPTVSTTGVLPLYVGHVDRARQTATHFFFPLNVYHRTPTSSALVLFPLVWSFRRPGFHSLFIAPVLWHQRNKKGWNADVLFPLFWSLRKGRSRTLVLGPVYWSRAESGRHRFGIAPIFHVGWDNKTTWAHLFPLFWHYRNREKKTGVTIAGPYYSVLKPESRHSGVLPLAYWGRKGPKSYAVGFPLVWHFANKEKRSSTTFLGPVFWHRRGNVTGGGILPLLWVQRGPHRRFQLTLLPLLHYEQRTERYDFWTPLFGFGADRALAKSYGYVGPVYWEHSPKRNAQVVFPLFWRFAHPQTKRETTFLLPFYFGQRNPEKRMHVVFPFVWYTRSITKRTLFVLPLFYDEKRYDESRTTALVPFFFRRRVHYRRETTWIFPPSLYIQTSPAKTDVVLFPLVWHFGGREKSTTVGFPLYWDFKRPGKRATVFFPIFWRFQRKRTVKMVILNTYVRYEQGKGTYQVLFLPLFEVARKRPGDFKFSVLAGLVGYERIGRNRRLRLFWIPIKLKPLGRSAKPGGPVARPAARSQASFYPL